MKMLSPDVNLRLIAPKRRNVGNPWFKRGTLARGVIDIPCGARLRRRQHGRLQTALLTGKKPEATRHQATVLQAAVLAVLRKRNGGAVVGDGPRGKWRMKDATN